MKLKLTDLVDSKECIPYSFYDPNSNIDFITLQCFLDNEENHETFRYLNNYNQEIEFENEVYEYLDSKFYSEENSLKRKQIRNK